MQKNMKMSNINFKDSTLLITGGTGSFGEALVKRAIKIGFKEIRIFSRDEKKQNDMRLNYKNNNLKFYIGDIRDSKSISNAMNGVNYVFHAAALKQVPSCEFFPIEAIKTNCMGTENVIDISIEHGVKNVVILSTDKAVYPINVLGLTKSLSEKIMIARSRTLNSSQTIICGVRYGNVAGSRGSVIPLFLDQIKNNKSVTITDVQMTRFLMSLDESIDLVLYALNNGRNGNLFIYKAKSAFVRDIVQALNIVLNKEAKIKNIGIRHGEKLNELLISNEEMIHAVDLGKFLKINCDDRSLDYEKYYEYGVKKVLNENIYSSDNTLNLMNVNEICKFLFKNKLI